MDADWALTEWMVEGVVVGWLVSGVKVRWGMLLWVGLWWGVVVV